MDRKPVPLGQVTDGEGGKDIPMHNPTPSLFRLPESLFQPIVPELLTFVRAFPWDFTCKYEPAESKDAILSKLSETTRMQLISGYTDVPLAIDKRNIRLPRRFNATISETIASHLVQAGMTSRANVSGALIYPPRGWMGWHTNSDRPGWRLYVNYAKTQYGSFFRWFEGDDVKTEYDKAGFNFRLFRVGAKSDLFWHCVYADDWRLSLGYWLHDVTLGVVGKHFHSVQRVCEHQPSV